MENHEVFSDEIQGQEPQFPGTAASVNLLRSSDTAILRAGPSHQFTTRLDFRTALLASAPALAASRRLF